MLYVFSISKQTKYTTNYFMPSPKISYMTYVDAKLSINRKPLTNSFYYTLFNTNHIILYFLVTSSGRHTHSYMECW